MFSDDESWGSELISILDISGSLTGLCLRVYPWGDMSAGSTVPCHLTGLRTVCDMMSASLGDMSAGSMVPWQPDRTLSVWHDVSTLGWHVSWEHSVMATCLVWYDVSILGGDMLVWNMVQLYGMAQLMQSLGLPDHIQCLLVVRHPLPVTHRTVALLLSVCRRPIKCNLRKWPQSWCCHFSACWQMAYVKYWPWNTPCYCCHLADGC